MTPFHTPQTLQKSKLYGTCHSPAAEMHTAQAILFMLVLIPRKHTCSVSAVCFVQLLYDATGALSLHNPFVQQLHSTECYRKLPKHD